MKTALLTVGLTGVFFAVGVLALRGQLPIPGLAAEAPADPVAQADSLAVDSAGAAGPSEVDLLADELATLQLRLAAAEAQADSLRRVAEARDAARSDAAEAADEAEVAATADLAGTLAKMEDEALAAVVQRLDGRSFVQLYDATTSRNRGRLLDALTPRQAAAFVRHRLPGGAPVHLASATADTSATR